MKLRFSIAALLTFFSLRLACGEQWLLQNESLSNNDFRYALSFLERYRKLLDSSPREGVADTIRKVKEDGLQYKVGKDKDFQNLTGTEDFSISLNEGIYNAEWSKDNKIKVACTFPANIGLLTFSNKIELENNLISRLSDLQDQAIFISRPNRLITNLRPVTFSDFLIEEKGFYITPLLRHHLIFSPIDKERCELLVDTAMYQLESLSNMMLSGYSVNPTTVNLKMDQYGYKSHDLNVDFAMLFKILSEEGSIPYWGIDIYDGKIVKGLYVWLNQAGGFAHMLSVSVPIDVLTQPEVIDAKLHCYLRLDNLKNLFEEYR